MAMVPKSSSRKPFQFRLATLLAVVTVAAIGLALDRVWSWREIAASLRRDLAISSAHSMRVVDFAVTTSRSSRKTREEAIFVESDGRRSWLKQAFRDSSAVHPRWRVSLVQDVYDDGTSSVLFFEREFDHPPSKQEIASFVEWTRGW